MDHIGLSLRRMWRRRNHLVLLLVTIVVLTATVATALSALSGWIERSRQEWNKSEMSRIKVTALTSEAPLTASDLVRLGQTPGCQAVPSVSAVPYVQAADGRPRPIVCSSILPNDPAVAEVPVLEGAVAGPSPSIVLAPNLLQRLGYPTREMAGKTLELRVVHIGPDRREHWCRFPCRVAAVLGDLGMDGMRMDLERVVQVIRYQQGHLDAIPNAIPLDEEGRGSANAVEQSPRPEMAKSGGGHDGVTIDGATTPPHQQPDVSGDPSRSPPRLDGTFPTDPEHHTRRTRRPDDDGQPDGNQATSGGTSPPAGADPIRSPGNNLTPLPVLNSGLSAREQGGKERGLGRDAHSESVSAQGAQAAGSGGSQPLSTPPAIPAAPAPAVWSTTGHDRLKAEQDSARGLSVVHVGIPVHPEAKDPVSLLAGLEEIHAINLYVADSNRILQLSKELEATGKYRCQSKYYELGKRAAFLRASGKIAVPFFVALLAVTAWTIFSTIGEQVKKETPLICHWRSVGGRAADIFTLYFFQGLSISLAGSVLGAVVAMLLVAGPGQELTELLQVEGLFGRVPGWETVVMITLFGMLSALIPALRAAALDLDKGLRETGVMG